jgi:hypothetical protein
LSRPLLAGFGKSPTINRAGSGQNSEEVAMKVALRPTWKGNLLMLGVALVVVFAVAS